MKKYFTLWPRISTKNLHFGVVRTFHLTVLMIVGFGCTGSWRNGIPSQVDVYDVSSSAQNYPKVPPDQIIVYPSKKFAPKQYLVLARLKSGGDSRYVSQEDLFEEFKEKAGALGADAVIILETTTPGEGVQIVTGQQPINDLGYVVHSHDTGITQITPNPDTGPPKKIFRGYALAIRSILQDSSGKE